jgi:phosphoglycolate phosphatase-like HAD superfamily hydrolase
MTVARHNLRARSQEAQDRGADAVAIGDAPYDAEAAGRAKIATISLLCGGFTESTLRQAGCVEIYPGPATLFVRFKNSLLAR